jgi:hypothetical protein
MKTTVLVNRDKALAMHRAKQIKVEGTYELAVENLTKREYDRQCWWKKLLGKFYCIDPWYEIRGMVQAKPIRWDLLFIWNDRERVRAIGNLLAISEPNMPVEMDMDTYQLLTD